MVEETHSELKKTIGYSSAKKSLPKVVKRGKDLEDVVEYTLKKSKIPFGRKNVQYSSKRKYASINEDFVITNKNGTKTLISVTHSHPTIPGHSNENKLHQHLGELYLFKTHNPNNRCLLVLGGEKTHWLSYVIDTLDFFYDEVIHTWDNDFENRLINAPSCPLKHKSFWENEKAIRDQVILTDDIGKAHTGSLRTSFFDEVIVPFIKNGARDTDNTVLKELLEVCNTRGSDLSTYFTERDVDSVWSERSVFNPPEEIFAMLLDEAGFEFKSEYRGDSCVIRQNLLKDLGFLTSNRRTDFILETKKGEKVFVECKSSGGGEGGKTNKHITDRSREQIARSLIHRTTLENGELVSNEKDFHWFFILDNNWRTPKRYPLKYIHILQYAGVDDVFGATDLVTESFEPNQEFELLQVLEDIGCRKKSG